MGKNESRNIVAENAQAAILAPLQSQGDSHQNIPRNFGLARFTAAASRASQRDTMPTPDTYRSFALSSCAVCASPNAARSPTVLVLGSGAPGTP